MVNNAHRGRAFSDRDTYDNRGYLKNNLCLSTAHMNSVRTVDYDGVRDDRLAAENTILDRLLDIATPATGIRRSTN